jgi:hypothetical protein
MRAAAAVVAALVVLATMLLSVRLARGTITTAVAGLLTASVGASPFLESFTLSGELLASLPAVLSLLAFCLYLERRQTGWLVLAGVLTGCALLIKQSAFDAGLAAFAYLLWRERREALRPAAVLVGSGLAPIAVAAATAAPYIGDWWYGVVGYRFDGDSLFSGSAVDRFTQLWHSVPPGAKGLGVLILLAAVGWRRSPLLLRLWLGAAVIGVLGGGNFHPHYYIQLVPPLAVLAAIGARRLVEARSRLGLALADAALVATVALTVPLMWDSPAAQTRAIWPRDPHLAYDAQLARFARAHTTPRDQVLAIWADASFYYLARRTPATRYLWLRPVQVVPGALEEIRSAVGDRRPALIAVVQDTMKLDPSGRTRALLFAGYRRVADIGLISVFERK